MINLFFRQNPHVSGVIALAVFVLRGTVADGKNLFPDPGFTSSDIRVSMTNLHSDAWIAACYTNQADPDALLTFGETQTLPSGTIFSIH